MFKMLINFIQNLKLDIIKNIYNSIQFIYYII